MKIKRPPAAMCAIYTRDWSANHDEDRKSHQEERDSCVAFVASQREHGWRSLRTRYIDSEKSVQSPALHRLLDCVRTGKVQVVVVYRLEDLSVNLVEFARIVEPLHQYGAFLVSVSQQINSKEPGGKVALDALLSFASFEKKQASETLAKIDVAMPPKPSLSAKPPGYDKYLERTKNGFYESRHTIRLPFLVLGPERKKAFLSWARKGFRLRKPAASQPAPMDPAQTA
jgi:site-specific DNA recombinase